MTTIEPKSPTMTPLSKREEFVVGDLWSAAWNASVQRSDLYKKNTSETEHRAFKAKLFDFVTGCLLPCYITQCGETQHYKNITALVKFGNINNSGILGDDGYKYGVAQKLLNLFLKYYWCVGYTAEPPPHCPVDDVIIGKTKYRGKIKWTLIVKESEYCLVIDEIKRLAHRETLSPSEWELREWASRRQAISSSRSKPLVRYPCYATVIAAPAERAPDALVSRGTSPPPSLSQP